MIATNATGSYRAPAAATSRARERSRAAGLRLAGSGHMTEGIKVLKRFN
ncbi:hypothetical protein [Streptomyces yangpuensis]